VVAGGTPSCGEEYRGGATVVAAGAEKYQYLGMAEKGKYTIIKHGKYGGFAPLFPSISAG
jgi:hypothetical protein